MAFTSATECVNVDISIFPTPPPPPPPPTLNPISEKLLKILKKYKYNWRINQLAKPRKKVRKFIPVVVEPLKFTKVKLPKLDNELIYYSDQISRPPLRVLAINKNLYSKHNGRRYEQKLNKLLEKSWGSIYNFYKKKERDKKLRQLRREAKQQKKKPKMETFQRLATPKKTTFPPEDKTPKRVFSDFERLDVLAAPKPFVELPPKRMGVNPAALTYEITEAIVKLAQPPERFRAVCKPLEPGKVQRSALRYKITERVDALAVPKQRSEKAKVDEDFDPFAISKNALKYKATPRILEMAKPKERD